MDYINLRPNQDIDENGLVFDLGSLHAIFNECEDIRKAKGKQYSLAMLLLLMTFAKLGGEATPVG